MAEHGDGDHGSRFYPWRCHCDLCASDRARALSILARQKEEAHAQWLTALAASNEAFRRFAEIDSLWWQAQTRHESLDGVHPRDARKEAPEVIGYEMDGSPIYKR